MRKVERLKATLRRASRRPAEVLVLLSGGIDSAACLDFFVHEGRPTTCLFIDYGQAGATHERAAARAIARHYAAPLRQVTLRGAWRKGEGLIPARNLFLLVLAALERTRLVRSVVLGVHAGSHYWDCSADFVSQAESLIGACCQRPFTVIAPFLTWTKAEILQYCEDQHVPINLSYSCERGLEPPCGVCLSCRDRSALDACP